MPFIPKSVVDRCIREVEKFQKILEGTKERGIPKAGTQILVADILAEVFGFDKYTEITGEVSTKGSNVDLAILMEEAIQFLVVVKALGADLKESHARSAVPFAVERAVPWILLTNGQIWQIFRIRFGKPTGADLICSMDFMQLAPRRTEDQETLFLLCKEGLKKAAIEEFHYVQIVNRFKIGAIIQSDPVLETIRRELERVSGGILADSKQLCEIVANEVLKEDLVEGNAAKEAKDWVRNAVKNIEKS